MTIATIQDGCYVIRYIKHRYQDEAVVGQGYHKIAFSPEISNVIKGTTNGLTILEKENYLLWHRRFNHFRHNKITNLHKVTNFS
jgi:hypothetical protein